MDRHYNRLTGWLRGLTMNIILITALMAVGFSRIPISPLNVEDNLLLSLLDLEQSLAKCGPYKIDIRELTVARIQEYFDMEELTAEDLTTCYLKRISAIDPFVRSVIEVNPDAIALAREADLHRPTGGVNKASLHGIPILLKDNIGTADSMQTTIGAVALQNVKPKFDAVVVKRLREAGAIILGKASVSEWANFRGMGIPNGWNGRNGRTISPYVVLEDPSGSSTGSAVAVAANFAAISLGTETDGSLITPSAKNAIVGLKPTLGAVSTKGVIPLAFSNDVVGPMCRSVQDAATLMGAISDVNLHGCNLNIANCLDDQIYRIGVVRNPFWNRRDTAISTAIPALEKCLDIINERRWSIVADPVKVPIDYVIDWQTEELIIRHEFKYSLNNYLRDDVEHLEVALNRSIHTLADVIKFNELNPSEEGYNQDDLIFSDETDGILNKTYLEALGHYKKKSKQYLDSIFDQNNVDALATPCFSERTHRMYQYGAAAGYPSITVPVGTYERGMPFGLCLLGKPNSEAVLLKLGYYIEKSRDIVRPVPKYLGAF